MNAGKWGKRGRERKNTGNVKNKKQKYGVKNGK